MSFISRLKNLLTDAQPTYASPYPAGARTRVMDARGMGAGVTGVPGTGPQAAPWACAPTVVKPAGAGATAGALNLDALRRASDAPAQNGRPTPAETFLSYDPTPLLFTVNVALIVDVSASMPAPALSYVFGPGIRKIVETLHATGTRNGFRYNLCVIAFNGNPEIILPFTYVDELVAANWRPRPVSPSGVSRHDRALRLAYSEIDRVKGMQDEARVPREGTLSILVTDGDMTDDEGCRVPIPDDLAREIRQRNDSRRTIALAFGMGSVREDTLGALGPGCEVHGKDGEVYQNPHAFIYGDPDYSDVSIWERLMDVIALGSSSNSYLEVARTKSDASAGGFADGFDAYGVGGPSTSSGDYVLEPVFVRSGDKVPPDVTAVQLPQSVVPVYGRR